MALTPGQRFMSALLAAIIAAIIFSPWAFGVTSGFTKKKEDLVNAVVRQEYSWGSWFIHILLLTLIFYVFMGSGYNTETLNVKMMQ
jgi:Mn2+/Fe2+ NRAMP family transporter